jgi:hypothetical protein
MGKPTFLGPLIGKGAGQYELINADGGSVLAAHVEPAFDSKSRKHGLLGRDSVPDDYVLIIAPCSGIHTFSMRFPMDAVFVSRDGTVVKTCRDVKPWRISVAWRAYAVIEAAAGFIDRTETVPGDVVALREIPHEQQVPAAQPPRNPTPTPAGVASRKRHSDSLKRLTLADIAGRQAPIAWFESVAVVQELCEVMLARGAAGEPRVPELKHIALTPDGSVELLAEGPWGHSPVRRASLILLALTPEAELPVQLRLVALEEVSPRPKLGDLKDLHKELEFFERPDRRDIVRGVYERFRRQPAPAAAEAAIPSPLLEPPPPKSRHHWRERKLVWAGLAIVLIVAGAAPAQREWRGPDGEWMRSGVSQAARAATAGAHTIAQVAREQWTVLEQKLGVSRRYPTPTVPIRTDLRTVTPSSPAAGPAPSTSTAAGPTEPSAPASPFLPRAVAEELQATGSLQPAAAVSPSPGSAGSAASLAPSQGVVYTSADPLVTPPQLGRPALAGTLPLGVRKGDMAEVEIVVSTTGEVETVKLLAPGKGPRPAMMLSAVKAWRFQPATRGGVPVRYRLRLQLRGD